MITTTALSKLSAILVLLSLLLIAAYPVFAQDATRPATTKRDQVREKVETRKETIKERIATREAALKAKLQAFKDKKKAEIADRLNSNLNKINQKQTGQMLKHLDKMSAILNKLEARVNKGTPDIKDPQVAKISIAQAKASIASATAAVKIQSEKDYTLQVSSESAVRKDAQKKRTELHTDLLAVRKLVIDAKQAVANAIRVAKSGKLEIPAKEGTPSGQ